MDSFCFSEAGNFDNKNTNFLERNCFLSDASGKLFSPTHQQDVGLGNERVLTYSMYVVKKDLFTEQANAE